MTKNTKLLTITILLTALLLCSVYAIFIPNAHAEELTIQQKGLAILNNVVGLDLPKYMTSSEALPQDSYLGVVPQENLRLAVNTNGSTVDVRYTFANGNLRMMQVLESSGAPQMTKTAVNTLDSAKDFLNSYQQYSAKPFYAELSSMLNTVNTNKNYTKISGNVKLEVNNTLQDLVTFKWMYTINGVDAPSKCVALGYEHGLLKYFIDNWDLYNIGSTVVNVSEKAAVNTAMQRAETFSWRMGNNSFKVKDFKVGNAMVWETVFLSNLYADTPRSEDPLMLYPIRHVWVSLDKFYP